MAPVLRTLTPWIEDTFVRASSFHPDACADGGRPNDGEYGGDDAQRPLDSRRDPNGGSAAADETRIARVVRRGGHFHFSPRVRRRHHEDAPTPPAPPSCPPCPPYLVLYDGLHSAVAFLPPEAAVGRDVPPDGSLVAVSRHTISTVLQCTSADPVAHRRVLADASSAGDKRKRVVDPQLHVCLYLQGPLVVVGHPGNPGGPSIRGDAVDVHRSAALRTALAAHRTGSGMYSYPSHEDPSHSALIRRLEARHCHRLLEAGDVRGPQWPWRSRLITPKVESPEGESAEPRGYSSEDGFGGGRLDIVGLVDAHPDPRGDPLGDEYTDGDLALMDWIRERAVPLRRLRRKLDRSYRRARAREEADAPEREGEGAGEEYVASTAQSVKVEIL